MRRKTGGRGGWASDGRAFSVDSDATALDEIEIEIEIEIETSSLRSGQLSNPSSSPYSCSTRYTCSW